MIELKEDGYVYISERGIKYNLSEGINIGTEQIKKTGQVFITIQPGYDVDNLVVGCFAGASWLKYDTSGFTNQHIKEMVNRFEQRNFTLEKAKNMWEEFKKVPINQETEKIECRYRIFGYGTHINEIREWFEKTFNIRINGNEIERK